MKSGSSRQFKKLDFAAIRLNLPHQSTVLQFQPLMVFFTTRFLIFLAYAGTFLAIPLRLWSQPFNDPCFTSPAISTTFASTANVSNNNADCMSWNGAGWTGSWGGANITLAPPGGTKGLQEFHLPSEGIQPGMYLIRLTKGGMMQQLRWMVQ
jgi:hypothetical protein